MFKAIWRTFISRSSFERWLLVEAAGLSLACALALRLLPFRWVAPRLGVEGQDTPPRPTTAAEQQLARQIAQAVQGVNGRFKWRNRCLVEAITGKLMLRRRGLGSRLFLGVHKNKQGKLRAHAWLTCGEEILTGAREAAQFKALTSFTE